MELFNFISVQKESFERFMGEGLSESFAEFSPIELAPPPSPAIIIANAKSYY